MAKFVVSLTETTLFHIPVEAETAREAEQKARRAVTSDKSHPCFDSFIALNDEAEGDPPGVEQVADDVFAQFIQPKAA